MKGMTKRRCTLIFFLVLMCGSTLYLPVSVDALPFGSFALDPTGYWVDESVNVDINYSPSSQVVTMEDIAWLEGWLYRKSVTITGSVGAGVLYQVNLTVVYDSDMQADFDDLRFTDDDGVTELDYWIESYVASTSAIVWVEVADTLSSSAVIYMYYGNSGVSTTSDGDATFLFFDDFNDASLNLTKWAERYSGGTYSEAAGVLTVNATGATWEGVGALFQFGSNYAFGWRGYTSDDNKALAYFTVDDRSATGSFIGAGIDRAGFCYDDALLSSREGTDESTADGVTYTSYSIFEVQTFATATDFVFNRVLLDTHTTQVPIDNMGQMFVLKNVQSLYVDWTYTRKCIATEPLFSAWGVEESRMSVLALSVPLLRYDLQTYDMMINVTSLNSTVELRFCDYDYGDSGFYLTFSGSVVTLSDLGTSSVPDDGLLDIRFILDNAYRRFTVSVFQSNGVLLDRHVSRLYNTYNRWFNISSSSYDGLMTWYYLTGDVDYSTLYTGNDWEMILDSSDDGVYQGLYGMEVIEVDNTDMTHHVTYAKNFYNFQYMRTEQVLSYIPTQGGGDYAQDSVFICTFVLYNLDGTECFRVEFSIDLYGDTVSGSVDINSDVTIEWDGDEVGPFIEQDDDSLGANQYSVTQIMVWRDLSDCVGVGFTSDTYLYQLSNVSGSRSLEDFTIWTSPEPVGYWGNSSVELDYDYHQENAGGAEQYLSFNYNAFEYSELVNTGVAQPHFSSTFWDAVGAGWNYLWDSFWTAFGVAPLRVVTSFNNLLGTVGLNWTNVNDTDLAADPLFLFLNDLMSGFLELLWSGLIIVVIPVVEVITEWAIGGIVFAFNGLGEMFFDNPEFGTSLIGFLGGVLSMFGSLYVFGLWFVTMFSGWIVTLGTYLTWASSIASDVWPILPLVVVAHIGLSYLKSMETDDYSYFMGALTFWFGIAMWIINMFIRLTQMIVDWIVNLIPFT